MRRIIFLLVAVFLPVLSIAQTAQHSEGTHEVTPWYSQIVEVSVWLNLRLLKTALCWM